MKTVSCLHIVLVGLCSLLVSPTQGVQCPARVRPQPGITMGTTLNWIHAGVGDGFNLYSGPAETSISDCCPNGKVANWTISLTDEYEWVGAVTATCQDGTQLKQVKYGFNGTDKPTCDNKLRGPSSTISVTNGAYSYRSGDVVYQLFGVGRPYTSYRQYSFYCRSGQEPIGFSARPACYGLADFQVLCAPQYSNTTTSSSPAPTPSITSTSPAKVLSRDINTCPTGVKAVPDPGLGNAGAWSTAYNASRPRGIYNPAISSAAGPAQSDCCNSGSISDWTIIYSDLATLGSVSATCSDGNILAPITYGFNDSSTGDCDNYLDSSSFASNPSGSGNFGYRANDTVTSFLTPYGSQALRAFSCPPDTVAIGYSAQPSCLSLVNFQVLCAPLNRTTQSQSPAPAPAPSILPIDGITTAVAPSPVERTPMVVGSGPTSDLGL